MRLRDGLTAVTAFVISIVMCLLCWQGINRNGLFGVTAGKTLVVHIFADTDPQYIENLKFFVHYGISGDDAAEYVIIVQSDVSSIVRLLAFSEAVEYSTVCLRISACFSGASSLPSQAMLDTLHTRMSVMTGVQLDGCSCALVSSTSPSSLSLSSPILQSEDLICLLTFR